MAQVIVQGIDRDITVPTPTTIAVTGSTTLSANTGENYTGKNRSYYEVEVTAIDAIGSAVADGGNTGSGTCASGGTYTDTGIETYTVVVDGVNIVGSASFTGSGVDNCTSGGAFTGTEEATYVVQIDGTIGFGTPEFNGTGANDLLVSGTYTENAIEDYIITIDGISISDPVLTGGGVDDLSLVGQYSGSSTDVWTVQVDTQKSATIDQVQTHSNGLAILVYLTGGNIPSGDINIIISGTGLYDGFYEGIQSSGSSVIIWTPFSGDATGTVQEVNKFRYKIGAGSYSTYRYIDHSANIPAAVTVAQSLEQGIQAWFGSFLGHYDSVYWTSTIMPADTFRWENSNANQDDVAITGSDQALGGSYGLVVTFSSHLNHVVGDTWTFSAIPDTFRWSKNGGIYISNIPITTSSQDLSDGATVTFATNDDHTLNEYWTIATTADTFKWQRGSEGYGGQEDILMTGSAQTLTDGIQVTFGNIYLHDDTDTWTITTGADVFKWKENNEDYTEDIATTGSAQTLSKGIQITFSAQTGADVGDTWEVRIQGDLTITRPTSNIYLEQYVVTSDYVLTKTLVRLLKYNLQTGATTFIADDEDGNEHTITESSEVYTESDLSGLITDEQSDLSADLTEQDPGDFPDNPVGGY